MQMNRALKLFVNGPIWDFLLVKIFLPNIFKLIDKNPMPVKALEIGAGIGTSTRALARQLTNTEIIATDYDESQVKIANKRMMKLRNVTFLQADATKLPFAGDSFDAVFIFNSLHHIKEYEQAISEAGRVLAAGGFLYIMDEGAKFFNPILKMIDQPEVSFIKEDIIAAAERSRLRLVGEAGTKRLFYLSFKKFT